MPKAKKTTQPKSPSPITLASAMRLTRTWTWCSGPFIARGHVEVSKRRIAMILWRVLDDGRLQMDGCRYLYLGVTRPEQALRRWREFKTQTAERQLQEAS
jgi:hypothetical protein